MRYTPDPRLSAPVDLRLFPVLLYFLEKKCIIDSEVIPCTKK